MSNKKQRPHLAKAEKASTRGGKAAKAARSGKNSKPDISAGFTEGVIEEADGSWGSLG